MNAGIIKSLADLSERVSTLEKRIAQIAPSSVGFICKICKEARPKNWYLYSAAGKDGVIIAPICGECARNFDGKTEGPFPQTAAPLI